MDRRFLYPASGPTAVFNVGGELATTDRSLPYHRERRATDQGHWQGGYMGRSNAVPWWVQYGSTDTEVSPSRDVLVPQNDRLKEKKNNGLIISSSNNWEYAVDDGAGQIKQIRKTTEPQLWRKIGDAKRAVLTEVNGQLVWRQAQQQQQQQQSNYDIPRTTTTVLPDGAVHHLWQPQHQIRTMPQPIARMPYTVY